MKHRITKTFLALSICTVIGVTPLSAQAACFQDWNASCVSQNLAGQLQSACRNQTLGSCAGSPMLSQVLGLDSFRSWCQQLGIDCSLLAESGCSTPVQATTQTLPVSDALAGTDLVAANTDTNSPDTDGGSANAAELCTAPGTIASAGDPTCQTVPKDYNSTGQAVTTDGNSAGQAVTADSNSSGQTLTADGNSAGEALTADSNSSGQTLTADGNSAGEALTADSNSSTNNDMADVVSNTDPVTVAKPTSDAATTKTATPADDTAPAPKTADSVPSNDGSNTCNTPDSKTVTYSTNGNTVTINIPGGKAVTYQLPGCSNSSKVVVVPSTSVSDALKQLNSGCTQSSDANASKPDTRQETNSGSNAKPQSETPAAGKRTQSDTSNTGNNPRSDTPVTDTKTETKAPAASETSQTVTTSQSDYVNRIVELVNQERAAQGLSPVTLDSKITQAAQVRANEIVTSFSHTRPNGSSFSSVLKEAGISYRGCGENIAWGQRSPEEVMEGWMNSPGHRANILNASYKYIGVGYTQSGGTKYWSQLFTY